MEKLDPEKLDKVTGGKGQTGPRGKYVSAFFCELCGKTIRLNGVYSLERAKDEHMRKVHPQGK